MKAIPSTIYRAFDGTDFPTAAACRTYEAEHLTERLTGLTLAQIIAAASREDADLADAFEEFGKAIREKRRGAGEFRRKPKNGSWPQPAMDDRERASSSPVVYGGDSEHCNV
jgi:hypothetical protein